MSEQVFLAYWSTEGFECILDITEYRHQDLLVALDAPGAKEKTRELNSILNSMSLRARVNPQRSYECYVITAAEGIEQADLEQLARETPQAAADLFRAKGVKVFSHRSKNRNVIE